VEPVADEEATAGDEAAAVEAAAVELPPSPKPQPALPLTLPTAAPEQIPVVAPPAMKAQQDCTTAWLQSAVLKQPPVMNWRPLPLPTFLSPFGSGVIGLGAAMAMAATVEC
jgi:hypothetical protein